MFIIDNLRQGDDLQAARAEAFLAANPDPGVRERPREQMERAFATGFGVVLSREGVVCGISLVYDYDVRPPGRVYHEIGTQRVSTGGYGMQTLLAAIHLLQIDIAEWGAVPDVFAVVGRQTASEHNLVDAMSMSDWAPPDALAVVRAGDGTPFNPEKRTVAADASALVAAYASLRSWHRAGRILATPKGGETVRVDMRWFDAAQLRLR